MPVSKTSRSRLIAAERREFVMKLKLSGATYRQIAAAAISHFGKENLPRGWDARYAYKDVDRELTKTREEIAEAAVSIREIEVARLDRMMLALWPQATSGHQGAVDRILRIMKRRAELLGLDAPKKVDHNVNFADMTDEELDALIDGSK